MYMNYQINQNIKHEYKQLHNNPFLSFPPLLVKRIIATE